MTYEEPGWKPLYVSSIVGGGTPGNRSIRDALQRLARAADSVEWSGGEDETGVDVVFHVTGPLIAPPDYSGMRTGTLSRKRRLITVQVAVPVELEAVPEEEALRVFARDLVDATELARTTVARRKDTLPVRQAGQVAERAAQALTN
ncbi:hypothetical protein AB0M36_17965 [Actinoplanes sp. NPDC051346]|uniref:hypothetical protein n=1 Tax=Actinoplanes sp. NPDC051346 TaxID=3155048 RepID=UPI003437BABF